MSAAHDASMVGIVVMDVVVDVVVVMTEGCQASGVHGEMEGWW